MARSRRLDIRVTAEEAAFILEEAREKGLTVSDFVRETALKRTGFRYHLVGRRRMSYYKAELLRPLMDMNLILKRLADSARANGTSDAADLEACFAKGHALFLEMAEG